MQFLKQRQRIPFVRICFYIGATIDFVATLPLLFPGIAEMLFGLNKLDLSDEFLYVSRVGASLMLGWTFLLVWGSLKPIERRAILILTVFPVICGLALSSIAAVTSGFIHSKFMVPLWIVYAILIPSYVFAYGVAKKQSHEQPRVIQ